MNVLSDRPSRRSATSSPRSASSSRSRACPRRRTARRGNLIGAAGAVLACVVVFLAEDLDHVVPILVAIAVGTAIGVPAARRVAMTQMPQLVALFNGVGGAAAALVAALELTGDSGIAELRTAATAACVHRARRGGVVLRLGRHVRQAAGADDHPPGRLPGRPGADGRRQRCRRRARRRGRVRRRTTGRCRRWLLVLLGLVALLVGVLFVLPVGGADVPIVISLLNAFTGLTVAASGYVLDNVLLLVAGTLVGASGTILTRMMAAAMGRSTASILFGAFKGGSTAGSTEVSNRPVRSASAEDVAILLGYARKVVIVPGYGLAVAQAQHTIHELVDVLEKKGIQVVYGIHPVAGRMPGHMNVLLAEANVPYEQLKEMDEVNSELSSTDVALVVGANDVVNPAAKTSPGSPIYGMPILDRRRRQGGGLPQALDAARVRRHRERAAVRARHDAAVRRRQGHAHQGAAVPQDPLIVSARL